jgi:radical SAM superfamily enzyme YgiQ (UPF0313 family)
MKIALIAMSGVRIKSETLNKLGVTLPGFVQRGKVIAALPSLGLLTLAALVPPEDEIHYIEVSDLKTTANLPADFDLVCISSFTAQILEAYELADRFRTRGVKVALGGLHVTQMPAEAKQHADAVLIGEGELTFPDLLADTRKGRIQPYYLERDRGKYDLALSPLPRFDLLDPDRYNRITIQTQRGCPHVCPFCASTRLFGRGYRQKPVELVIRDLEAVEKIWPRPFIEFADDNTFVMREYGKALCKALVPHKIRWFTETDISVADDEELLDLMYRSGCEQILIGLETIADSAIREADLHGWKAKKLAGYRDAIARIQSRGITVNGCFILGFDGHDRSVFENVRQFALETNLLETQVTLLTPMAGTETYSKLRTEGRLLRERPWDACTLFDVTFRPTHMSVQELEDGLIYLFQELYNTSVYTRRKRHYMEIIKALESGRAGASPRAPGRAN